MEYNPQSSQYDQDIVDLLSAVAEMETFFPCEDRLSALVSQCLALYDGDSLSDDLLQAAAGGTLPPELPFLNNK